MGRFEFHSDGTPAADAAVTALAAVAEPDYQVLKAIYGLGDPPQHLWPGNLAPSQFVVHVDSTVVGAYHSTPAMTEIWTQPVDAPSLLVLEVDEVFQDLGALLSPQRGPGEGHSRAMQLVRPPQIIGWLNGDVNGWWRTGNPSDYFTNGTASDRDDASNACNTLGWFWLWSLGYDWAALTAAGGANLGETYTKLTGKTGAEGFAAFVAACKVIQQPDGALPRPGNPFPPGPALPLPAPVPVPWPIPSSGGTTMRSHVWQGDCAITQSWGCTTLALEPWWPAKGCYWHCGVDLGLPLGTKLLAARAGTVSAVSYGLLGIRVGAQTDWYVHIDSTPLRIGEAVARGQIVAYSGAKVPVGGSLTGPHLHFEVQTGALNEPSSSRDPSPVLTSTGDDMTPEEHDDLVALSWRFAWFLGLPFDPAAPQAKFAIPNAPTLPQLLTAASNAPSGSGLTAIQAQELSGALAAVKGLTLKAV